jgi:hypothetical protein
MINYHSMMIKSLIGLLMITNLGGLNLDQLLEKIRISTPPSINNLNN